MVQDDTTSLLYFILVLELILKRHEGNPDNGVIFWNTNVHTLDYVDDAVLLDGRINTLNSSGEQG